MERNAECTLCGREEKVLIPGAQGHRHCLECFLLTERINWHGLDLLAIVSQLDILAGTILGETGAELPPEILREWAIQLREKAEPILADIYRDAVPDPEPIPEPPDGVDALHYYLEMMREDERRAYQSD